MTEGTIVKRGDTRMRMKGIVKRTRLSSPGVLALGVLGLLVIPLAISGCSSGSDSQESARAGSIEFLKVEASATAGIEPTFAICGGPQIETFWARGWINGGTVSVSNDQDYMYVQYNTVNWGMRWVAVHVGQDITDYPGHEQTNHNSIPSQFDYRHNAPEGEVLEECTLAIQLSDFELQQGDCGMTFYIFAYAKIVATDGEGNVTNPRLWPGWGGTDKLQTDATEMMYCIEYTVQCCDQGNPGEFRTQSQGGWGTYCHGENPGCYRDGDGETYGFDVAFPDDLVIGCDEGQTMTFTSSEAVRDFLPSGGKPSPLEFSYLNPTGKTEAGVLAAQVLALALTLGFDLTDPDFGSSDDLLADQIICNTGDETWDEMELTVQEVFDEANLVLGGCEGTLGLGAGELNELLTIVNENYVDGEADLGFLCAP